MLLGILHRRERLLRDVCLFTQADFLRHFSDMILFQTLCCQSTNDRDLLLELHQEVFLALCKAFKISISCSLKGILKTRNRRVKLLPVGLNFLSIEFIDWGLLPVSLILFTLGKSRPKLFKWLELLVASFKKRELLHVVLEVNLLLVNQVALLFHRSQSLFQLVNLFVVLTIVLLVDLSFEVLNLLFDFLKVIVEIFNVSHKAIFDFFALRSQRIDSFINLLRNTLDLIECVFDLLLDLIIHIKLWILVHELDPLDKLSVLSNNLTSCLATEFFEFDLEANKVI